MGVEAASTPIHLVVLCHGLWGEPKHLHTLETLLERSFGGHATVVRAKSGSKRQSTSDRSRQDDGGVETPSTSNGSDTTTHSAGTKTKAKAEEGNPKAVFTVLQDELLRSHASEARQSPQSDGLMNVVILNTSSNRGGKTYDGVDWLAERVVREIKEQQASLTGQGKYIARFSMIGYSLGGLVVRFALGLLESQAFFTKPQRIHARQIITIATPHIGSPPGAGAFGRLVGYFGAHLLSRTGEQIYTIDEGWQSEGDERKIGLLECMSRPGSIFIRALNRFEKINFYANAVNDVTVPFRTGCIEEWDPFVEQAGCVDVQVLPDAPILTDIQVGEMQEQTVLQSIKGSLGSPPPFLNPKRLPFSFPYNYIAVAASPVLLPLLVARIWFKLSKDSKESRLRIADMERGWEADLSGVPEGRINRLVKGMVISAGEDNVEEERNILRTDAGEQPSVHGTVEVNHSTTKAPWHSPWQHGELPKPKKQLPLSEPQRNMVRNLNDAQNLPRLTKVWAYFPDVINSHAVIIARSLAIESQRCGLPVVKHIVDNFLA